MYTNNNVQTKGNSKKKQSIKSEKLNNNKIQGIDSYTINTAL